jgi:hypothetical protein
VNDICADLYKEVIRLVDIGTFSRPKTVVPCHEERFGSFDCWECKSEIYRWSARLNMSTGISFLAGVEKAPAFPRITHAREEPPERPKGRPILPGISFLAGVEKAQPSHE